MTVVALSAVPAAPLLIEAAAPRVPAQHLAEVSALRDAVGRALRRLPERATVVLVAGDTEPLVHDAGLATLASYGLPDLQASLSVDLGLLAAIAARGQAPRVRSDRLDGDLAVLALLVAGVRPGAELVPMLVPRRADASALSGIAAGVMGAATAIDRPVAIVAAADLAATLTTASPGYLVEGAGDWDAAAMQAARAVDLAGLAALGPARADQVQARGWAPLTVLIELAARLGHRFDEVSYHAPRGVGQLVAA